MLRLISFILLYTIIGFLFSGMQHLSAQTTICAGDDIVLEGTDYLAGDLQWQESADSINWTDISGATQLTHTQVPTQDTYYRLQVTDSGCSPPSYYTEEKLILLTPPLNAPIATAGTTVSANSFDANWNSVAGATAYYLDVASDSGFTAYVSGYNSVYAGNNTTKTVSGLSCETDYYYRVRAANNCEVGGNSNVITYSTATWTCGCPITDARDGKTYHTVLIGSQCWMKENLDVGAQLLSNGAGQLQTDNGTIEKYCFDNDPAKCDLYGGLYEWEEAMDYAPSDSANPGTTQGICPAGWHLPTDEEWCELENFVDPGTDPGCDQLVWRGTDVGSKLKDNSAWNGTNTSGFSALPGGYRKNDGLFYAPASANLWSAKESGSSFDAWRRLLIGTKNNILRGDASKVDGQSVRCIMD